jgi:hypothetical protein
MLVRFGLVAEPFTGRSSEGSRLGGIVEPAHGGRRIGKLRLSAAWREALFQLEPGMDSGKKKLCK